VWRSDALYNEILPSFTSRCHALLGISVDGRVVPRGVRAATRKLRLPLLADFEPKGRFGQRAVRRLPRLRCLRTSVS